MEKKVIFIVDDEKNIRLTMSQSLESLGIPIRTAVNGEEALQMIRGSSEIQYGLVFLDLKMPGMNGMDVLRRIREEWSKIRVIVITAHGFHPEAVQSGRNP
jgi:CheY-like chemotaxis protein